MARGRVHQPRAAVRRDVITTHHNRALAPEQRVGVCAAFEDAALHGGDFLQATSELLLQRVDEILGDNEILGPALLDLRHLHHRVQEIRTNRHCRVGGDGPGRGRPDGQCHVGRQSLQLLRGAVAELDERHGHVDALRGVPLRVLQLSLRQCGPAARAPMDGFLAAVDVPVQKHLAKHTYLGRLVRRQQRHVRVLPFSPHAIPLELIALRVHRLLGELGCLLSQLDGRERLAVLRRHGLQHLQLDGQPVAVPPGHVAHLAPLQHLIAVNEVLEDLVEGVTDVQVAVSVWGAVVQNEGLVRVFLRQPLINLLIRPKLLQLWLFHHRIRAHVKLRYGQVHRGAVNTLFLFLLSSPNNEHL
mmetsp:Transcript_21132/g.35444  ORF Transcript_21132/g.35444 Transcript_21132/m.35444 type:complete len:358 (-) Transcript_21132:217-1290(-)